MWILFALGSAVFAGITAILAKIGVKKIDSNLATAVRTIVVLIISWSMVFIVGSQTSLWEISAKTVIFLVLSGLATGASWLCYFKAMQLGDVNKVTPVDKSSIILTIILALVILGEAVTIYKVIGIVGIGLGTFLMIQKKPADDPVKGSNKWLMYAILSAVFASLTSILGKIGIQGVESNLGTAIRTIVVLIMSWVVVFVTKNHRTVGRIDRRSFLFICLSGIATGASWLCYYRALQDGPASVVVPIDKLSIALTIAFSYFFLKEKLSKKSGVGLVLVITGTLVMLI